MQVSVCYIEKILTFLLNIKESQFFSLSKISENWRLLVKTKCFCVKLTSNSINHTSVEIHTLKLLNLTN